VLTARSYPRENARFRARDPPVDINASPCIDAMMS
jgi:hypothetical protein